MKLSIITQLACGLAVLIAVVAGAANFRSDETKSERPPVAAANDTEARVIVDSQVQLCQGVQCDGSCGGQCVQCAGQVAVAGGYGFGPDTQPGYGKSLQGINQFTEQRRGREPTWRDSEPIPWEAFAYGEYIGPHRTPDVPEYRLRVNDVVEFVYLLTREKTVEPYRLYVGDVIQIISAIDVSLNQNLIQILPDGTVSLTLIGQVQAAGKTVADLQAELNEKYQAFVKNPSIIVRVEQSETPLQDLLNSVDARFGQGGQGRAATVSPDGTVQLPLIGSVPAVGLTLDEIGREVNARYRQRLQGIGVTPILTTRAPRFIYVVGEVQQAGRFELTGPTTAIQAVALAGGFRIGGNIEQIVVFRRDQNWRLNATLLDLSGALYGKRPYPSDEIWLRDSDIVLIPKKPIQRLSEAVNLYITNTLFRIFPQVGIGFNFDTFENL